MIRDDFPDDTGFYARGANTDSEISLLGQSFRKAPVGGRKRTTLTR